LTTQAKAAVLEKMIAEEAQVLAQFIDLLKLEQDSLSNGNIEALAGHAEQKTKFGARLNSLAAQRNAALTAQGLGHDRSGIDAWCAGHPGHETTATAWSALLSLAGEARQLNRTNGDLIQIRMRYNAKALEALRGGNSSLDLYGPDGQSRSAAHRRINDTV
jgi:flagella synthesis protein FlgN